MTVLEAEERFAGTSQLPAAMQTTLPADEIAIDMGILFFGYVFARAAAIR
jgi:hypothetical protein